MCGAILGATLSLLAQPVPDAAYTAVRRRKKHLAALRSRNRQEAAGQGVLNLATASDGTEPSSSGRGHDSPIEQSQFRVRVQDRMCYPHVAERARGKRPLTAAKLTISPARAFPCLWTRSSSGPVPTSDRSSSVGAALTNAPTRSSAGGPPWATRVATWIQLAYTWAGWPACSPLRSLGVPWNGFRSSRYPTPTNNKEVAPQP